MYALGVVRSSLISDPGTTGISLESELVAVTQPRSVRAVHSLNVLTPDFFLTGATLNARPQQFTTNPFVFQSCISGIAQVHDLFETVFKLY